MFVRFILLFFVLLNAAFLKAVHAQETYSGVALIREPAKLAAVVDKKALLAEAKLDAATGKYLDRLQKQEAKLRAKLQKKDSALAEQLFSGVAQQYAALRNGAADLGVASGFYSGRLDSLTTALHFLDDQRLLTPRLQSSLSRLATLHQTLDRADAIKRFVAQRRQLLKANLEKLGMLRELKGFQKQAYYYARQLSEYKQLWEDPSKLEQKLLEVLSQTEAFKDFFRNHSQLGSLFALPGNSAASVASLAGLQTRASVQQGLQDRFGSGAQVQQLIQQNLQSAQGQLTELKNKLAQYGSGSYGNADGELALPEGFKPNGQKTKTFLQRLEYGANVQSQKARTYFPVTSDLGLSLGYRLNDNSSVGVGASYKIGWGSGWNHLRLTSEGVGLRSYIDWKLKGSLYISGGYEQNYRTAFQTVQQLQNLSAWQQSGLVGLSKKYQVSKKLKGEIKLLWDFLSYQQLPQTQPILFRIGYNLK